MIFIRSNIGYHTVHIFEMLICIIYYLIQVRFDPSEGKTSSYCRIFTMSNCYTGDVSISIIWSLWSKLIFNRCILMLCWSIIDQACICKMYDFLFICSGSPNKYVLVIILLMVTNLCEKLHCATCLCIIRLLRCYSSHLIWLRSIL